MNRRGFVRLAVTAGAVAAARGQGAPRAKAVVIGHTGRGNFGHGMELVFLHRPDVETVAVADPDAAGRERARLRAKAPRAYADYREMLEKERPHIVSVAPRHTDQHHALVAAALAAGAHVYCEKPFTTTLAEADDLLARAAAAQRRIAVAHQGRLAPETLALRRRIEDGALGELLEFRVVGKQDRRAGGEDMVVLGTHQFDLVRYLSGAEPLWCSARILQAGREVERRDIRAATEAIGPVVGDDIAAQFAFPQGLDVHYTSRARNAAASGPWGMEIIGTKARARLLNDPWTTVWLGRHGAAPGWERISADDFAARRTGTSDTAEPNRWVVDDLLAAVAEAREPACSGTAAAKSLEMIHAGFAAGVARERVSFPLRNRAHPLA